MWATRVNVGKAYRRLLLRGQIAGESRLDVHCGGDPGTVTPGGPACTGSHPDRSAEGTG
jgi:hypothetical protein